MWQYTNKPREEWDFNIWVRYYLDNGALLPLAEDLARLQLNNDKEN